MRFSPNTTGEGEAPAEPTSPRNTEHGTRKPKASPLARAFRAVPDATLHFLLDSPADFDAALVRKDFLGWAEKHGRTDDSDWRPAWSAFVQSQKDAPPAPARPVPRLPRHSPAAAAPALARIPPVHPWAARLRKRLHCVDRKL